MNIFDDAKIFSLNDFDELFLYATFCIYFDVCEKLVFDCDPPRTALLLNMTIIL